jgi:hypothetical protein
MVFSLAPIATVEYLKPALSLAGNHDLGVMLAEFYLSNWPACSVNLPENYRRATRHAPRSSTRAQITASPDLNSRWRGIEVGFEHFGLDLGAGLALSRTRR